MAGRIQEIHMDSIRKKPAQQWLVGKDHLQVVNLEPLFMPVQPPDGRQPGLPPRFDTGAADDNFTTEDLDTDAFNDTIPSGSSGNGGWSWTSPPCPTSHRIAFAITDGQPSNTRQQVPSSIIVPCLIRSGRQAFMQLLPVLIEHGLPSRTMDAEDEFTDYQKDLLLNGITTTRCWCQPPPAVKSAEGYPSYIVVSRSRLVERVLCKNGAACDIRLTPISRLKRVPWPPP